MTKLVNHLGFRVAIPKMPPPDSAIAAAKLNHSVFKRIYISFEG